jgi:hypothetical protein
MATSGNTIMEYVLDKAETIVRFLQCTKTVAFGPFLTDTSTQLAHKKNVATGG